MAESNTIARARGLVITSACLAGLVLSACGVGSDGPSGSAIGMSTLPAMVPWCDDVEHPGPVRDAPAGMSMNVDPIRMAVLQTYGEARPETYAGVYVDRASRGTTVVAFTDAPEPHRAALLGLAPTPTDVASIRPRPTSEDGVTLADAGFAFDVVQVAHTTAELEALQRQIEALLGPDEFSIFGVGQSPQLNRVSIQMGVVDDDQRAALAERFPVDEVCVSGTDAASVTTLDPSAPTTLLPPAGDDPTLECSGLTFPASALRQTPGFEQSDDPLAIDFRSGLATNPMLYVGAEPAGSGWILLAREGGRALLATRTDQIQPLTIQTVTMESTGRRWIWSASGGCRPRVALPAGLGPVGWVVARAPAPTDTEIHLMVSEQSCASGRPLGDRLVGPDVQESASRIVIAFAARLAGDGPDTCQSNPPEPVTVTLAAPVGGREIVDGLTSFGG